jgi:hypothetical protein
MNVFDILHAYAGISFKVDHDCPFLPAALLFKPQFYINFFMCNILN